LRRRLLTSTRELHGLLAEHAAGTLAASALMRDLLGGFPTTLANADRIHELERAGDAVAHSIVRLIERSYVLPYDREDVYALVASMDDICDHLDEAADEVVLYGVRRVPPAAVEQAALTHEACRALTGAIGCLEHMVDASEHLLLVHTSENAGDRVVRSAIAGLFAGGEDALVVIRWKDIHEQIEAALDSCERTANVIEGIYLKHR